MTNKTNFKLKNIEADSIFRKNKKKLSNLHFQSNIRKHQEYLGNSRKTKKLKNKPRTYKRQQFSSHFLEHNIKIHEFHRDIKGIDTFITLSKHFTF